MKMLAGYVIILQRLLGQIAILTFFGGKYRKNLDLKTQPIYQKSRAENWEVIARRRIFCPALRNLDYS